MEKSAFLDPNSQCLSGFALINPHVAKFPTSTLEVPGSSRYPCQLDIARLNVQFSACRLIVGAAQHRITK